MNTAKVKRRMSRSGRARRRGVSIVLVSLAMVALLGFCAMAVDYGFLTNDANQLQRACDAAALAGASYLKKTGNDVTDTTNAASAAVYVAFQNGVTITTANCTFLNNNTQIKVTAGRTQAFMFARALGQASNRVTRAATAGLTAVSAGKTGEVAPIGITQETYNAYKNDTGVDHEITLIRQNKTVFQRDLTDPIEPDPMVLFDLRSPNGKSGPHFERELTGDDIETSTIGDLETTLDSNLNAEAPNLQDGIGALFQRAAQAPWNDPAGGVSSTDWQTVGDQANNIVAGTGRRDNPRVIDMIVTPSTSVTNQGTFNTQVVDFAPVYVVKAYTDQYTILANGNIIHGNATGQSGATQVTVTRLVVRFLPPNNLSSGNPNFIPGTPGSNLTGERILQLLS